MVLECKETGDLITSERIDDSGRIKRPLTAGKAYRVMELERLLSRIHKLFSRLDLGRLWF